MMKDVRDAMNGGNAATKGDATVSGWKEDDGRLTVLVQRTPERSF